MDHIQPENDSTKRQDSQNAFYDLSHVIHTQSQSQRRLLTKHIWKVVLAYANFPNASFAICTTLYHTCSFTDTNPMLQPHSCCNTVESHYFSFHKATVRRGRVDKVGFPVTWATAQDQPCEAALSLPKKPHTTRQLKHCVET